KQRRTLLQHTGYAVGDVRACPHHVTRVDSRLLPLWRGHVVPREPQAIVENLAREDVSAVLNFRAIGLVHKAGEAKAVSELVQQHCNQVNIGAMFVIKSVVPAESRKAWRSVWISSAQAAVKLRMDIISIRAGCAGEQICIRQLIC